MRRDENLQRLIDAIPMGVHVIDPEGRIVEANRAWLIEFGLTWEDVGGRHLKDVMKSMIFCDSGSGRLDDPWEFTAPAALETLRTRLPARATFNRRQAEAVARPILDSRGNLRYVVTTVVRVGRPAQEQKAPEREPYRKPRQVHMVGRSPVMERVMHMIGQVAKSDATVLITGPTGTGKEVAASEIQRRSQRAGKPFVQINCAAIPENLMEAELFGYEKGAFTGALKNGKIGLLEYANGGTVFLDEIGELPLALQPKLLRAIQERTVVRVGGLESIPIDVRIIASTNRDLARQVEQGLFREDLYYRLNVIPLQMPALKERGADIVLLGKRFLEEFNGKYDKQVTLSERVWELLLGYPWPGNVRELRNFIERLVVLTEDGPVTEGEVEEVLCAAAGPGQEPAREEGSLTEATDRLQRRMIQRAMELHRNTYRAADALGISQSTLIRKAKRLGVATTEG